MATMDEEMEEEVEEVGAGFLEVKWTRGFPADGSVAFADAATLCYASGDFIKFAPYHGAGGVDDDPTGPEAGGRERHLRCPGAGVAALAVSAPQGLLAFADRPRPDPTVHVLTQAGGVRRARLRGAARLEVSALALSDAGPYLAAWAAAPDLSLSLWDWQQEKLLCRYQAEQRRWPHGTHFLSVTALSFCPGGWQQLCTVGDDHVCVWSVERSDSVYRLSPRRARLPADDDDGSRPVDSDPPSERGGGGGLFGPRLPAWARAGLVGPATRDFVPEAERRAAARPVSHCWARDGDRLFVGCAGGQLLCVEADAGGSAGAELAPRPVARLGPGRAAALAASRDAVYAGGADGALRRVRVARVAGDASVVDECWASERPILGLAFSPDLRALAISTARGSVHVYRPPEATPAASAGATPAAAAVSAAVDAGGAAPFACAAVAAPDGAVCVSAREDGAVQLWAAASGRLLGGLALGEAPCALACPASSRCAALGTASGRLCVVDARRPERPRLVLRERLTRAPLDVLRCDEAGRLLVAAASSEGRAFVVDARPSRRFAVLGFVEDEEEEEEEATRRRVLDASVVRSGEDARLLLLLGHEGAAGGDRLAVFHLPGALGGDSANPRGDLSKEATRPRRYELAFPATAAALGRDGRSVFVYCGRSRLVKEFAIAEGAEGGLGEARESVGHDLPDARLVLAAGGRRLYSASSDGVVRARAVGGWRRGVAQAACHCPALGGVRSLGVSADGRTVVTAGWRDDGALVCLAWRGERGEEAAPAPGSRDCAEEDAHLASAAEREPRPASPGDRAAGKEKADDGSDEAHAETRRELRERAAELRRELRELAAENEAAPECERLPAADFLLDVEAIGRLREDGTRAVEALRDAIRRENAANAERRDALRRQCWDAMATKGRCLRAFLSGVEVWNFPVPERGPDELRELERVKLLREVEMADRRIRRELLEGRGAGTDGRGGTEEEERDEEDGGDGEEEDEEEEEDIVGTLSEELGVSCPYLYRQLELHSREQRVNQTVLLRDVARRLRVAFNADFDSARRHKEQEAARARDAGERVADLLADLASIGAAAVATPTMPTLSPSRDEEPERALAVDDAEVTAERFLADEQRAAAEERAREEERARLAERGGGGAGGTRSRALRDMMGGELEVRRDGAAALRPLPQPPAFASRPESEWTEEERRQARDFERESREVAEERERLRRALEAEVAKTRAAVLDGCRAFDESLARLAERRARTEAAVCQEELRLALLGAALLFEEELDTYQQELRRRLEENAAAREESDRELREATARADALRESYDDLCAEDKLLERAFKRDLAEMAQGPAADALARLYKRRPRAQKLRAQTDAAEADGEGDRDEPDPATENVPEGVEPPAWERFCRARGLKARGELALRRRALAAAEADAFARRIADEREELRAEAERLAAGLDEAREEAARQQLDATLLVLLKQGQVEVDDEAPVPDYSDARLVPRDAVEALNATIRAACERKVASMESGREARRAIARLQWECRKLSLRADELRELARDVRTARVSRELLANAGGGGGEDRASRHAAAAEKNLAARLEAREREERRLERRTEALLAEAARRRRENASLDARLPGLRASVSERGRASEAAAATAPAAEEEEEAAARRRHERVARERRAAEAAREQAREIAALRVELERMRMRSFPALVPADR
uniref:Cilia- and flagella-associated protein 43 n=1 Tax=Petromyzon marinus TaxID=7757 RepID=A0AAJ7XGL7_PETMA|nr:cilia- and flagella-associated protein 43 [Petromyzon marinus]